MQSCSVGTTMLCSLETSSALKKNLQVNLTFDYSLTFSFRKTSVNQFDNEIILIIVCIYSYLLLDLNLKLNENLL